jgi:hypothetical protein
MVVRLPPEIHDLEDFTESQNWMLYGPMGVGKTSLMGQLPNLLILAAEPGTISAKRRGSKAKLWKIKHLSDFTKAYEWLANNDHPFQWIAIDSITMLQNRAIRAIMEDVVKANSTRDPDIPAKGDHFKWQLVMKRIVTDFVDLPINTIWTAHEMVRENPNGEDILLPLVEGKDYQIAAQICGMMDVVGHYDFRKVKVRGSDEGKLVRRLTVSESPPIYAKDRYGVMGRYVNDPNLAELVQKIEDSFTGKPARTTRTAVRRTAAKKATTRRRVSA